MPVINIQVLQDILGGTEVVDASITATVNRASIDAYRIENQFIIFPRDIKIPVVNGVPSTDFVLTVLPPSYYWHVDVFVNGEAPVRRNVIVPGNVGPYDFEDLIDVIPETALPDAGTAAANAYAALIESYALRAEAAALAAEGGLVINATAPATFNNTTDTVGVNQDGFDHISNLDYIQLDTTNTVAPTTTGRIAWNQNDGTVDIKLNDGVTLQVGQEANIMAANFTGSLIPEGAAVHVLGAQGGRLKVALASASSEAASANTIGIVTQSGGIAHGSSGYVTTSGLVRDLNLPTASFSEGDILWLGTTPGTWSRTRPVAPAHGVQMGYVVNTSNGNAGSMYVNVQNGYEIDELHSVLITNPQEGDILVFRSGLWRNEQP